MLQNESCSYNKSVDCPNCNRKCNNCGWNPVVSKKRIKAMKDKSVCRRETN